MKRLKRQLIYSAIGGSAGLTGPAFGSFCRGGGTCTSCWGCAGVGLGLLILLLFQKLKRTRRS